LVKFKQDDTLSIAPQEIHVLIAEDDEESVLSLTAMLKVLKIKDIILVNNGLEALEQCKCKQFDLILMDIKMPVLNGLEATKAIRELKTYSDIPIIATTSSSSIKDQENCFCAGMNSFLAKPIKVNDLTEVINNFL